MKTRILEYIRRESLIQPGDRVLLAVSGGPDSVCLLHLLLDLRQELDLRLGIAHVNHGLRGAESDGEEQFVRELARKSGLLFHGIRVSVPELSRQLGKGTEETARQVRYEFFDSVMREAGYDKTALAHNLNDQAETILHRLIRGAGLNGLAGMRPIRDDVFIRPLLEVRRGEVEAYLARNGLDYRTDSSNLTMDYTRNRIRLELIPLLEGYNPDVLGALSHMSEALALDRDYLEGETAIIAQRFLTVRGGIVHLESAAFASPRALTARLIFMAIQRLKGDSADISRVHIRDVLKLQAGETGHSLDLPGGILVYNHYGNLEFSRKAPESLPETDETTTEEVRLDLSQLPVGVEFGRYRITIRGEKTPDSDAGLAAGRFDGELIIRHRRAKDRMKMLGMTGYKKLKDIFIDKKIHRGLRGQVPVITDPDGEIAYIYPGICGEEFRITENTDKMIYITVTEIENG